MSNSRRNMPKSGTFVVPEAVDNLPARTRKRATGRATIADVARLAAVSPMTVSRTLKDPTLVTQELRDRVLGAVAELGYVPNLAAQTLASSRSNIIGVIVPSISNSVFVETLAGIRDCVSVAGYQVIIGETLYSADTERQLLSTHLGRAIDGVLVTGVDLHKDVREGFSRRNVPLVHMFDLASEADALSVGFSQMGAGEAVGRFVIEKGYKRPALLAAQLDPRTMKRREGFQRALMEAGHESFVEILTPNPSSVALGGQLIGRLLGAHPECDVVFCGNDDIALGALFECQRRGIKVPEQLGIIGFNDLPFSQYAVPSITSVTTPRYEIGFQAAHMLLRQIEGIAPERSVIDLGFRLTRRESA
jgi:LacI family transcriptional regulator, gluconate utilization system Gnt-I transcriptional repressor